MGNSVHSATLDLTVAPMDEARRLGTALVAFYCVATAVALATTMVLALLGLEIAARQWTLLLLIAPAAIASFVLPDVWLIVRHYRPLRRALGTLDQGRTPDPGEARRALVRALNLPFYSFIRVTFVHGPIAALSTIWGLTSLNFWFDGDFAPWQLVSLAALILFFASPAHAIVEFFSISRRMAPVIERLWPYCRGSIHCEDERPVEVGLKSKLLYLCVFITALPLLVVAFSMLLKVEQLLSSHGIANAWEAMQPLWLWMIGVVSVCLLGALVMSLLTALDVSRSAARLIGGMNEVERGNLAVDLKITATDEYAEMYRGFNMMIDGLREEVRLLEVTQDLAGELHLDVLIGRIMRAATELLDADRSTLFLYDPQRDELWSRYAEGVETRELRMPVSAGIAGAVLRSGKTANITDPYRDSRFNPEIDARTGYRTRSILCMPIVNKTGKRIGVTQVLNKRSGFFGAKDEQRLRAFTAQIAVTLENAQLFDEVLAVKNYNENILASTTNGVITLDNTQRIATANNAALGILGLPTEQVVGCTVEQVFGEVNAWVLKSVARVVASGEADIAVDADLLKADGSRASVNLTATPLLDAQTQTIGFILSFEDFTREKRVKSTMARYMSKEVADQLLEAGEAVLGGRLQKVSILFSDVRDFTSVAEALGPRETVSMLNEYFEQMVEVIFRHRGILDKYIGDAMMALFGSPFAGAQDADNAVATANDMLRALAALNARRTAAGRKPMEMGIGIATGDVIVGNIGSPRRMEYTVIGDSVNLASRLEGATKPYGARILLSEATVRELKTPTPLREIDRLRVKGKDQAVTVYEALGYHDARSFPQLERCLAAYGAGLAAYRQRDWSLAEQAFGEVLALHHLDKPSQIYLERTRYYRDQPPPEDWDGVWTLKEK